MTTALAQNGQVCVNLIIGPMKRIGTGILLKELIEPAHLRFNIRPQLSRLLTARSGSIRGLGLGQPVQVSPTVETRQIDILAGQHRDILIFFARQAGVTKEASIAVHHQSPQTSDRPVDGQIAADHQASSISQHQVPIESQAVVKMGAAVENHRIR